MKAHGAHEVEGIVSPKFAQSNQAEMQGLQWKGFVSHPMQMKRSRKARPVAQAPCPLSTMLPRETRAPLLPAS